MRPWPRRLASPNADIDDDPSWHGLFERDPRNMESEHSERREEISNDFMGWHGLGVAIVRCTDQNSQSYSGSCRRFDVVHSVPYHHRVSEIEVQICCRLQDHSWIGLAPWVIATVLADPVLGMIRTVIHSRDRRTFPCKA